MGRCIAEIGHPAPDHETAKGRRGQRNAKGRDIGAEEEIVEHGGYSARRRSGPRRAGAPVPARAIISGATSPIIAR